MNMIRQEQDIVHIMDEDDDDEIHYIQTQKNRIWRGKAMMGHLSRIEFWSPTDRSTDQPVRQLGQRVT